jgi:hypothetical protein
MGNPAIKLSKHPRTGLKRMRAGMVKTLAMSNAVDNGAPTIKLDFEDETVPKIDFGMNALQSLTLFDLLTRPYDDFWDNLAFGELVAAPADRQAIDCGNLAQVAVIVDSATGVPTFTAQFVRGGPMPAVEFSLSPRTAITLMQAIMASAKDYDWTKMIEGLAQENTTKH